MKPEYKLRHYQKTNADFILKAKSDGKKSAIAVQPTGTGKTIVIAAVVEQVVNSGEKVLIMAHRNNLLSQASDKLRKACGIESVEESKAGDEDSVVVCSVQSMAKEVRLEKFGNDHFSLIVVDEVHHIESPSYQKVVSFFNGAFVMGVTATPVRSDGKDVRDFFDAVAPEYTRKQAVEEGYLSPVKIKQIPIKINISKVKLSAGDYAPGELAKILNKYLKEVARQLSICAKGKKTIVFVPLVETAQALSSFLNEIGVPSDYVSGARKDSDDVLNKLTSGELSVVTNAQLLTEGYDDPSVDCVVNLRPTKSETLYTQAIGRALRPCEGKSYALVLDLVWNDGGRGHLRPTDILIDEPDFFVRNAMDDVLSCGEEMDLEEVHAQALVLGEKQKQAKLDEAQKQAEALKQKEAEALAVAFELKESLKEYARQKSSSSNISYEEVRGVVNINPKLKGKFVCCTGNAEALKIDDPILKALGLEQWSSTLGAEWEQRPVSVQQKSFLEKLGIPSEYLFCTGQASYLADALTQRQRQGKASLKQLKMLLRYKVPNAFSYSAKEAKAAIDTISKNGWKPVQIQKED